MSNIHPTAIVAEGAALDPTVTVGPYTVIGPFVTIGSGTTVGAHCVIDGHTTIGSDNRIFQFNSIGAIPQDKKYAGEPTKLLIGDRNTIREFCTLNLGVPQAGGLTSVGSDNWIMAYTHIAHDCHVGNHTTLANNTTLAGHVQLDDWVTVGGLTGIHQFVKVGAHAMVGFASAVTQDIPPFMLVDGNPLSVRGLNLEGLRRRGFSAPRMAAIKQVHKALYRQSLTLELARVAIAKLPETYPEAEGDIAIVQRFLDGSTRGIAR